MIKSKSAWICSSHTCLPFQVSHTLPFFVVLDDDDGTVILPVSVIFDMFSFIFYSSPRSVVKFSPFPFTLVSTHVNMHLRSCLTNPAFCCQMNLPIYHFLCVTAPPRVCNGFLLLMYQNYLPWGLTRLEPTIKRLKVFQLNIPTFSERCFSLNLNPSLILQEITCEWSKGDTIFPPYMRRMCWLMQGFSKYFLNREKNFMDSV